MSAATRARSLLRLALRQWRAEQLFELAFCRKTKAHLDSAGHKQQNAPQNITVQDVASCAFGEQYAKARGTGHAANKGAETIKKRDVKGW